MVDTLFAYLMVELLLFPVTHHFIITSCMHDYSPFISVLTPAAQHLLFRCSIVPLLYPCSVLILFRCCARVYITLYTPSNNSFIQVRSYNVYRYIGDPASHGRSRTRPRPARTRPGFPTARHRLRGVHQAPALLAGRSAGVVRAGRGAVLNTSHHQPADLF